MLKLSAGTLYRSVERMVEQGLIRETARGRAKTWTMTAAILPHHSVWPSRRQGGGAPAGPDARSRSGEGARASEGVMRIYRLLLYLYPASFRADYGEEMAAIFQVELRSRPRCGALTSWFAAFHEAS